MTSTKRILLSFSRISKKSAKIEYTLQYDEGIEKKMRKEFLVDSHSLTKKINQNICDELNEYVRTRYKIKHHVFYLSKGSDVIKGILKWVGNFSDIGGALTFGYIIKKAIQNSYYKLTKQLPDEIDVHVDGSPQSEYPGTEIKKRPLGSGLFALSVAVLFMILLIAIRYGEIRLNSSDLPPETILQIWLGFSILVLGGWGLNRVNNNDGRLIVGQDTIKLVLAFVAITATLFSLILKISY